jgi:hypothetical protein
LIKGNGRPNDHPSHNLLVLIFVSGPGSNVKISVDPKLAEEEEDWYHRAISTICFGIVVHIDDAMVLSMGKSLLTNMIGSAEVAAEMIFAEKAAYIGDVYCTAAA